MKTADSLHAIVKGLEAFIASKIVGQTQLIESLLVCLLADGHVLIEGMPGLAKTTASKAIADGIDASFHRIQFTPDLLPSDLIGGEVYVHDTGKFVFIEGPLFNNIVLADEINRAPAKVQSGLLEAMAERQITVGRKTYELPRLYMVVATQNPIEQAGTYALPEAQLDRFLMHIMIGNPSSEEELKIIELDERKQRGVVPAVKNPITQEQILQARELCARVHVSDELKRYIVSLVLATRNPGAYDQSLGKYVMYGASPRASLALVKVSKAFAWLRGQEFVTPHHIHAIAPQILSHRIILSFEAEARGIKKRDIIHNLLKVVAVP